MPARTDDSTAAGAEALERLRQSGIRIDSGGELIHEGEIIAHPGLRAAIFRWLGQLPDGQYVLRLDAERFVYLDVDDTPLVVRGARGDGDVVLLALSDGSEEPLDPRTLTVGADGALRCRVRGGSLPARLATAATAALADQLAQLPTGTVLTLGGHVYHLDASTAARRDTIKTR